MAALKNGYVLWGMSLRQNVTESKKEGYSRCPAMVDAMGEHRWEAMENGSKSIL
jgi:hypothetical protein